MESIHYVASYMYRDDGTEPLRYINSVSVHEDYDENELPNDIALLILREPFTLNGAVKALPLAPEGHVANGTALVFGWGSLEWGGEYPDVLHKEEKTLATEIPELVAEDIGYKYFAGIVSSGNVCGLPNYPGVYTEVAHFANWIAKNLPQNY
ncbi:unnamed protein product [Allacma fusca]|uniref:Peptidase S1 domain-containing protein n=1 Tax=Allacma fusca TaxID=39272 RepID=A0A8J2J703_9HEXA|nr:unnamed protein product [Allacma fusca]